jgi:hypothetical protein
MDFRQVDAFTDKPFKGNPSAVFMPEHSLSDGLMQDIAVEMNLSETAFVLFRTDRIRCCAGLPPCMKLICADMPPSLSRHFIAWGNDVTVPWGTSSPQHPTSRNAP